MTREELRDYVDEQRELDNIPYHVYSALIDGIDTLEQDPCEKCNYVESSPFCLQYCPHDAERKQEQEPTERKLGQDYLLQSFVEALKVLQAENDDLKEKLKQKSCNDAVICNR